MSGPTITSIIPNRGAPGDNVEIQGQNLKNMTRVKFSDVDAKINSATDTSILTTVPINAKTGKISVSANATSNDDFVIEMPPQITDFNPKSGPADTLISITGFNLINALDVSFTNATTLPISISDTVITVKVPKDAQTGDVFVRFKDLSYLKVGTFTVIVPSGGAPVITDITPKTGKIGDQVIIYGQNLEHITKVLIGGVSSDIISQTTSSITTKVPVGAYGSDYIKIYGNATSGNDFVVGSIPPPVIIPVVSNYTPNHGSVNALITINGTNLDLITQVQFGTTFLSFTRTSSLITCNVPQIADGTYQINLKYTSGNILVGSFVVSQDVPPTPSTDFVEPQIDTNIRKGPYMIYPGGNMMTILWQLKSNAQTTLKWGLTPACELGNQTVLPYNTSTFQCKYDLSGLIPSTKYYYSLTVASKTITNTFVSAPPNADQTLDFLIFGDIQDSGSTFNKSCGNMLTYLKANPQVQGISFQLGDSVGGSGTSESDWDSIVFGNSGQYSNVTKYLAAMPINATRGNHNDVTLFMKYFPSPNSGKTFYGFDYGQIHFIAIDTESTYTQGSEQYTFIENELKNNNEMWKIPVFHRPGWSTGDNASQENVKKYLHPLFVKYGVKIVYMAHNHHFSWIKVDNVNYLTLGPIGASTKPVGSSAGVPIIKSYEIRHFNHININGNTLTHKIIHADTGALVDTLTFTL